MTIRTLAAAALLATMWGGGAAHASDGCDAQNMNHNGSGVFYENCGTVEIFYQRPKASMRRQGVRSGTVLFRGSARGTRVSGTAYRFKRGCAPIGYSVSGRWRGASLTLVGTAPIRGSGCAVTRYKRDRLRFD